MQPIELAVNRISQGVTRRYQHNIVQPLYQRLYLIQQEKSVFFPERSMNKEKLCLSAVNFQGGSFTLIVFLQCHQKII